MAVDKLVDSTQLDSDLTSVANAIRAKSGGSGQLAFPAGFVSEIGGISSGRYATGTFTPAAATWSVTIDTGLPEVNGIIVIPNSTPFNQGTRVMVVILANWVGNCRFRHCVCYSNSSGSAVEKYVLYNSSENDFTSRNGSVATVNAKLREAYGKFLPITYTWVAW